MWLLSCNNYVIVENSILDALWDIAFLVVVNVIMRMVMNVNAIISSILLFIIFNIILISLIIFIQIQLLMRLWTKNTFYLLNSPQWRSLLWPPGVDITSYININQKFILLLAARPGKSCKLFFWLRMEEEELKMENWGRRMENEAFIIKNWGWRALDWG